MKKASIALILVTALAMTFAACSGGTQSSSSELPVESTSSQASESSSQASEESSQEESAAESTDGTTAASEQYTTVTGTIEDASMNTITIKTEAGESLMFSTMDADMSYAQGLIIGTEATIYYTGELSGTDTSAVKVAYVTQEETESTAE
ncbi:MAG: hypothetical protein ACK5LX_13400 [Oscillospiraceae bacterium]